VPPLPNFCVASVTSLLCRSLCPCEFAPCSCSPFRAFLYRAKFYADIFLAFLPGDWPPFCSTDSAFLFYFTSSCLIDVPAFNDDFFVFLLTFAPCRLSLCPHPLRLRVVFSDLISVIRLRPGPCTADLAPRSLPAARLFLVLRPKRRNSSYW